MWHRAGTRPKPGKKRAVFVAAGGNNTIIVVEDTSGRRPANEMFSSGMGQWGQLGNGTYNHVQNFPAKVKPLSGLLQWDDAENKVKPIGFKDVAIGATHIAAVMDNVYTDETTKIEYGRDMMMWGEYSKSKLIFLGKSLILHFQRHEQRFPAQSFSRREEH